MKVFDPLYGCFQVPDQLVALLATPEVRRLSSIRLLNALSPSLATLGEIRRYSHTLGVLYLSRQLNLSSFTKGEQLAFYASAILHDIGTAPFAHLFEYHLREIDGWDHEREIERIMSASHAPENRAHQMFFGRTVEVESALHRSKIDEAIVYEIVQGRHPLSNLLFGTIDVDNLDNVARMAWSLGLGDLSTVVRSIAKQLTVAQHDNLTYLPRAAAELVGSWVNTRAEVYKILVFDPLTVSAQAVLSEAIASALSRSILTKDDWTLTDEAFINQLLHDDRAKELMTSYYFGRLPNLTFCVQLSGGLLDYGIPNRSAVCEMIRDVLKGLAPTRFSLGYAFEDRGAFAKQLGFVDPESLNSWSVGQTSRSVVLYGFSNGRIGLDRSYRALLALLEAIGVSLTSDNVLHFRTEAKSSNDQRTLDFPT